MSLFADFRLSAVFLGPVQAHSWLDRTVKNAHLFIWAKPIKISIGRRCSAIQDGTAQKNQGLWKSKTMKSSQDVKTLLR